MNWIPSIEVESSNGTRTVELYTRQLMNRNIFLEGEVNSQMASAFLNQVTFLVKESDAPINIFINSPGGDINSGLVIYDLMQQIHVPVNTYCTGMAASMAALLLAGGQPGRRFILPHSTTMIHEPLLPGGVGGSASSIKTLSNSILATKKIVNGLLARHTGKSLKAIDAATAYDHYMNAEESVKFGLCDRIKTPLD